MDNIEVLSNVSTGINTNFTNSGLDIIQKSSNQFSVINSQAQKQLCFLFTVLTVNYKINFKLKEILQKTFHFPITLKG